VSFAIADDGKGTGSRTGNRSLAVRIERSLFGGALGNRILNPNSGSWHHEAWRRSVGGGCTG
jgi:hypothetical protein